MKKSLVNKTVQLNYFSRFAELTQKTNEAWSTEAVTVQELWFELDAQYAFDLDISMVRPAVNHEFCDWQRVINDRDIISFIPPVSGG
ncbi:MoaD/ThiS family protein [Porticoccaceae bacterium]|jgi:molybdopterin synthase sulfur carrier subunit|nr:MoaD/ThiS family protein [Porticoccaceae bacterium]